MKAITKPPRRRLDEIRKAPEGMYFKLKSLSDPKGVKYACFIGEDGSYWCECPQNQHRRVFCKHLQRGEQLIKRQLKQGGSNANTTR